MISSGGLSGFGVGGGREGVRIDVGAAGFEAGFSDLELGRSRVTNVNHILDLSEDRAALRVTDCTCRIGRQARVGGRNNEGKVGVEQSLADRARDLVWWQPSGRGSIVADLLDCFLPVSMQWEK